MSHSSITIAAEDISLPWYRYFMPWFVIALLFTAVACTLVTVAIAVRNPPTLISTSAQAPADQPASIRSSKSDE